MHSLYGNPIKLSFGNPFLVQPVEDPEGMTEIIVQALAETSQRGIIDKGWGGIGRCKSHNITGFGRSYV